MDSKSKARGYLKSALKSLEKGMHKMGNEAKETKEMADSFFKLLAAKLDLENRKEAPSEEEIKEAVEQLKDVGRLSVFTTAVIIPGGVFSIVGLEMLARKLGVKNFTFVPSEFRKNSEWKHTKDRAKREKQFKPRRKNGY